jgi:GLPGLI family protein
MFSQKNFVSNAKVEYDLIINLDKYKGILYFNDNYSKFDYHSLLNTKKTEIKEEIISDEKINVDIQIKMKDTLKHFIYFNKKDDELIYSAKDFENNKLIIIKEKLPVIKWLIINEFKIIDKIQCQKATSKFRGRNYTAWFSKEIPSYFGPMKFGQLPGLILEIYDDKKEVIINATKITYPRLQKIINKSNYKYLSRENYLKNKNKYLTKINDSISKKINLAILKLGRNVKISNIKINTKINNDKGIELKDEN